MGNRVKGLMVVLIIIFVSCATTPKDTFKYTPSVSVKKLDLKAALIISDELKNSAYKTTVRYRCAKHRTPERGPDIVNEREEFNEGGHYVGLRTENLFIHGLPYLFNRVDVYKDIAEIKNKEDYDYILIPFHVINTSYNEKEALNRKIHIEYHMGFFGNKALGYPPLRFNASAEYQLKVLDAKNNDVIGTFTGSASSEQESSSAECYEGIGLSGLFPIGMATVNAFEDLLKKAEPELIRLANANLVLTAKFSDNGGFLPNNILNGSEDAELIVTVKNNGKKAGYGTNLVVTSANPKIIFERDIKVGDIQTNETKEIKVNLKAGFDIEDGNVSFQINLKEKNGYDARETVMDIKTAKASIGHALPSDLALNVRFSDTAGFFPNNSLDAGEDAEMVVAIKNTGKGAGYGTNLEISSDNPKIAFDKNISVGDIQPNETKEIKINLKSGLEIETGKASFQFNLKEKRGYDAKRVVMNVPTARLERPALEIVSTEINDGDTGLAKGNGNGIPESGETVEITAFIKNQGEGRAIGVNLNGQNITSGVQWVRDSTLIGTIPQGEIVKGKIGFSIPRNFDAKEIAANLKVSDMRGVSNTEKKIAIAYAKRSPDIQYAYRILSRGSGVKTITNGEEYEIELMISNKGQIPARGVVVSMSSGRGVSLSRSKIDLGDVKEQTSAPAHKIAFSVPRTFADVSVPVNLEVSQSDFSAIKDSFKIPVDVKRPGLIYKANLLSKKRGNIIEQGEGAVLEVQILNEGNLSAEGVRLKIESKDDTLKLLGQTEAVIGKIPANSKGETIKFELKTLRRIKVGDASLNITITQDDFSPVVSQYALRIMEEGAEVFDVASEDRVKGASVGGKSAPVINLMTALKGIETITSEETFRLAFEVMDSRNIESVKVEVNGMLIPLDEKTGLQPSKKKEIMKNVPLSEGENRIVITAYNSDNIPARKEFVVNRIGEEDVDYPPVTSLNNPDAVAVVIGISKYEDMDIPPVDYARRDAETVREYLIKTLGFKEKNIAEFYDEKATSTKLKSYFNRLKNIAKSDVFIFYSGHGVPESNEAYFAPYDLDPNDIKTTGYAIKDLYKQMEDIKAKSITIVIDACFSGKSEGDTPVIKSASPIFFEVSNPLLKVKNSVVLTSSAGKQISSWYHKKRHGLFTYYFLQGLRSKADGDNDGRITVKELSAYVGKNVSEQARVLYNREQTPEVIGDRDAVVVRFK